MMHFHELTLPTPGTGMPTAPHPLMVHLRQPSLIESLLERLSERQLLKALERLEESSSIQERTRANQQLNRLLERNPRALRSYLSHKRLEAQLRMLIHDPDFLAS